MHIGYKAAVAVAVAFALAGCTPSPKQQLAANCQKGGNSKESCKCFVDALGTQLSDKQMAALAKADKTGGGDQALQEMGMQAAGAVMGAAKKCNLTGAPGGMQ